MSKDAMSTSQKNETGGENAGKYASKSQKKKPKLIHNSKGKMGSLQIAAAYASTSSKNIIHKNINWHESEWPELPKSGTSSLQVETAIKEESHLLSSQCESSLKKDGKKSDKTESARKSCDKKECLPQKHIQKFEIETTQAVQVFTCPSKEVEDITYSLTALKMSTRCQQLTIPKNSENMHSQQSSFERRSSLSRRKGKKLKTTSIESHSHLKVDQEEFLPNENKGKISLLQNKDQSPFCDDDFPDLLSLKKINKGKKKNIPPLEDLAVRKTTKKYPRRNDPIFINLGEFLELASNAQDNKNVWRSRYSRDFWSAKTRIDTSRRTIKRGKQREFPKRKTLTKLKIAILRGRQQKKIAQDCFKTLQSVTSSQVDTSLEDCRRLQEEETLIDLKYLFGHCSSYVHPQIKCSQSELELQNIDLGACEKEQESRVSQTRLNPLTEHSYSVNEILQLAKSSIHTRKFRDYCSNDNCAILQEKVKSFVKQIYRFQTKSHFRDPEKARIHRRYVLGLREADKYFKLRKLKVVVIATDLEANSEEGGLDEIIENMKSRACKENIPIIFALKRRDLAYCVFRKVPVSCMAVLNYEGAEDLYRTMVDSWREAVVTYDKKLKEKQLAILSAKQDFSEKTRESSTATPAGNLKAASLNENPRELPENVQTSDEHGVCTLEIQLPSSYH